MENELGSLADGLPGLVWTARPDGRVDFVNRAWCEYSGRSLDEARDDGWLTALHPLDLPRWLELWRGALASGERCDLRARLRRHDGAYRRFVLRAQPRTDASGGILQWCGLGVEIDDGTSGDCADVRAAELRAIADSIPAFVGLAAPSGAVEYFNRFALDYLGTTLDRLTGWQAVDTVHPDDLPQVLACWKRAVETGEPYQVAHRVRRADGAYRWFQVRGLPLRDGEGRIERWIVVDTDVDEQMRGEALFAGEKQLLEMVARGRPRPEILDAFCRLVEGAITGCRCSIMLLDSSGTRMELGAGPSLPSDFIRTITGCSTGTEIGPCPTAVRLGEQVVAADLAAEPRWAATRWPAMAMAYGLRSCWSTPIASASAEVLGAFAVYHDRPRSPTPQDTALIDQLAQIASVTVERLRSQMSLAEALEEIRASEDRLRNIVDTVPGFVWSTLPDGRVDFLNQRWSEYTGMALSEARGFGWTAAVHADDTDALATYWQGLLETGAAGEYEARLRRFDGRYRWFLIRAVPQRDGAGRVVKWYGGNTDIDDRKRAELLLAGEKRLLGMMAGGASLSSILDEVCALVEATIEGALCSIVLVDPRSPGGATPSLRLHPGAAPRLPPRLAECAAGRTADADADPSASTALRNEPVISTDLARETRWTTWCSIALSCGIRATWSTPMATTSGKVTGVLSILYDQPNTPLSAHQSLVARFAHLASIAIERARSEAALKQSEAFLAKAQRLSLTGTFSWRVSSDEIVWSEEIYRIVEVPPGVTPTLERLRSRVHPEDAPSLDEVFERQRVDGRDFEHEHRLLMPDGRIKHVYLVAHATRDENGGLEYIAALQDVTQRRLSAEALGRVRSELAHVAGVASLGVLTASIAHEVNQPLAGIVTNASTCLRMLGADPPNVDGARETARRTIRDGNRASEVIQRLRALFAKKKRAVEAVDLNEAAREVTAMLLGELQRNGVIVHREFADELPPVDGDRVQLQQVILNLLLNASDAMREVIGRPRHLRIRTYREGNGRVCLAVRDSGTGFDPQDAERLFQAFYTTKGSGMGIGLSVSRSIIESHEGRLHAVLNDGPGATFSFDIPASAGAEAAVGGDGVAGSA